MRRIDCDIVVVGAGPAGSLAAMTASKKGANVILLEEHSTIGSPVSCAEGLSLNGIKDAGIDPVTPYVCQKIECAHIITPNKKRIEMSSKEWVGFNLDRRQFDKALGDNAVKAGVELMTNTSAQGVIRQGDRVVGVKATQKSETIEVRAHVTIGADGYHSIIRRSNGMERFFSDFCICAQYTLRGLNLPVYDVNEFYLGGVVAPGGYVWVFPKSDKIANVGIGVRKIHERPAFEYLDKFIKEDSRFKDSKSVHRCGGITPAGGVFDKITDNGLMLIGDAAGQVIPATGGGIHCAVEAGKMAGSVAVDAILSEDTSNKNLSKYRERFDVYWGNRIIESRKIVEMLDKFGDNEINMLAEVVTNEDIIALATGDGARKAVARIVARNPGKIVKLMLAYLL